MQQICLFQVQVEEDLPKLLQSLLDLLGDIFLISVHLQQRKRSDKENVYSVQKGKRPVNHVTGVINVKWHFA